MGAKQEKEMGRGGEEPVLASSMTRNILKTSSNSQIIETGKISDSMKKKSKESKEKELLDLVIREKNNIIQSNIKAKSTSKMSNNIQKNTWEELEKIKCTDETTSINFSSCNLSNSKVFERFVNTLPRLAKLSILIISDCHLTAIPSTIPPTVIKLDLKENLIKDLILPNLPELVYLDASYNRIECIPNNLGEKIVFMDLHNNRIENATNDIFETMNSLQTLNLSGNWLTEINFTIKIFTCLYNLNLSFNKIILIPGSFYSDSTSLAVLNISNNPLTALHPRIGLMDSLIKLDIRSTKITVLPSTLSYLKNLDHLFIDKVNFTSPPMHIVNKGFAEIIKYLKEHSGEYGDWRAESIDKRITKEDTKDDNEYQLPMLGSLSTVVSTAFSPARKSETIKIFDKKIHYSINEWLAQRNKYSNELIDAIE